MSQEVEKNLLYSGLLISLGAGGLLGFWWAVICAGVLLFSVALLVFIVLLVDGLKTPTSSRGEAAPLEGGTRSALDGGRG